MGTRDRRIGDYIAKSPEFARPILAEIRERIHAACPDVEETVKWGSPSFTYQGLMCNMAAFKEHCGVSFWKGSLIFGTTDKTLGSAGHLGRIKSLNDLPGKREFAGYVKKAMELNESGTKVPKEKTKAAARGTTRVSDKAPADLEAAFKRNAKARRTWEAFSPSHRREYVEWITSAKREETRSKRLHQTLEWLTEGKGLNWKYQKTK